MASAKQKNTQGDGDNDDKDNDSGLVDFNATDVKKVLKRAQKRGFITHDEINALLPNDEMTSDQIEDVMSQISEMGIAVVESEEEAEAEVAVQRRHLVHDAAGTLEPMLFLVVGGDRTIGASELASECQHQ